jgi:hypothetical protein
MSRARGCGGCLVVLTLLFGVPVGGSVWLDVAGRAHDRVIAAKHERIWVFDDGDWARRYELALTPAPGDMVAATVTVGARDYDALHPGDHVRVRSLDCCPIFARLADRTTASWVVDTGWQMLIGLRWILWAVLGVVALVGAYKLGRPAVLLAGAAWIAAATVLPGAYAPVATPGGDWRPADARVVDLHLIDEILDSRHSDGLDLLQPYYVVELGLIPWGARDTVVAVDAVDSGSTAGLTHNAILPVRYDPRSPRHAILAAGGRTYPVRNRPLYWLFAAVAPAALTVLLVLALGRRRPPATTP